MVAATRTAIAARPRAEVRLRDLGVRHVWPLWIAVGLLAVNAIIALGSAKVGIDAHAYWLTGHHSPLYWRAPAEIDAYLYSPAFAQVIRSLTLLPWPVFFGLWIVAESFAFAWLLKPLGWAWGVPAFILCAIEIVAGNITRFVAAAAVAGTIRAPGAWSFVLLTKPTLALGLPCFTARKEWRAVRAILAVTGVIVLLSALIWPAAWPEWIRFLLGHRGQDPTLPYRVALAWLLAAVFARRGPRWLLVPLMVLASPSTLAIGEYATLFAAVPRLRAHGARP